MKKQKVRKGFTLIEIMVVISLSAILGWLSYSGFSSLQSRFLDYQYKQQQFTVIQKIIKIIDTEVDKIKFKTIKYSNNGTAETTGKIQKIEKNQFNIEYQIENSPEGFTKNVSINGKIISLSTLKTPIIVKITSQPWQQKSLFLLQIYQQNTKLPIERQWVF